MAVGNYNNFSTGYFRKHLKRLLCIKSTPVEVLEKPRQLLIDQALELVNDCLESKNMPIIEEDGLEVTFGEVCSGFMVKVSKL